jgi:hypothetical protein
MHAHFSLGWFPSCYTSHQNLLPAPIVSIVVEGKQGVYVAPDSAEFIPLLGTEYTDFFDSIDFNWRRLAGSEILAINRRDAFEYVDFIAKTVSGNYLDHGVRVNSVFSSYRISGTSFSQRFGDLAGPTGVVDEFLELELITVNSSKPETVKVPYLASFSGAAFTDRES